MHLNKFTGIDLQFVPPILLRVYEACKLHETLSSVTLPEMNVSLRQSFQKVEFDST